MKILLAIALMLGSASAQMLQAIVGNGPDIKDTGITFTPPAGAVSNPTTVTFSGAVAGSIYCSTQDGSTPFTNGIGTACGHGSLGSTTSITSAVTVKAVSGLLGELDSPVSSAAYTISGGSGAAPAFVQTAPTASCGSGSGCTATLPGTPTVGNAIVIFLDYDSTTGTLTSVTKGTDTATICGTETTNAGVGTKSSFYIIKNLQSTNTFVGATFSPSPGFSDITAVEYSGADLTSPCDASAFHTNSGTTGTSLTPGASSPANNYVMRLNYCITESAGGPWTMTSTWGNRNNTGAELVEDKPFNSISSQNPAITSTNTGHPWVCQQAALVGASQ